MYLGAEFKTGNFKFIPLFEKPSSAECYVSENLFVFNVKPYYLRLRFTGQLVDNDEFIKCRDEQFYIIDDN